jgi:CRP-like cAMP-binding protein
MPRPHPLLSKLDRACPLNAEEQDLISQVQFRIASIEAHQAVVRAGDRPSRSVLVIDGLLATSKISATGQRQVMAFHISGDMPDIQSLHLEILDCDLRSIGPSQVAFIEHAALQALCEASSRIAAALFRCALIEAAIYREWLLNVGQRPALSRLAHLFCETMARMETIGAAKDGSCDFPVTQGDLSEAAGLSAVHINRTLQALRARGLISLTRHKLTIHDWDGLMELAGFQPDYLHLGSMPKQLN